MDKTLLAIATAALVISVVSITRREVEIKYLHEVRDLLEKVVTEIEYAKIIEHLDEE